MFSHVESHLVNDVLLNVKEQKNLTADEIKNTAIQNLTMIYGLPEKNQSPVEGPEWFV